MPSKKQGKDKSLGTPAFRGRAKENTKKEPGGDSAMVERDTVQHPVTEAGGTEVQEGGGTQSETQAMKPRIGTYKESPKIGKP